MKAYIPLHEKKALSQKQIDAIFNKTVRSKRVRKFIVDCAIPAAAFYKAMEGKPIKKTHINTILTTLKNY